MTLGDFNARIQTEHVPVSMAVEGAATLSNNYFFRVFNFRPPFRRP
jgi:hypothetical protein